MRRLFVLRKPGHLRLLESLIIDSNVHKTTVYLTQNLLADKDWVFLNQFKKTNSHINFIIEDSNSNFVENFSDYCYSQIYLLHYQQSMLRSKEYLKTRAINEVRRLYPFSTKITLGLGQIPLLRHIYRKVLHKLIEITASFSKSKKILESLKPDLLIVSPLIELWSRQNSWLSNARDLSIPSVYAVHSWDNLTTKGPYAIQADHIILWNVKQIQELENLHGSVRSQIMVSGSYGYDKWFEAKKSNSTNYLESDIRKKLDANKRTLLFLGSSKSISGTLELNIAAEIADAIMQIGWQMVYRMHPQNPPDREIDSKNCIIFPEFPEIPMRGKEMTAFVESILASDAVMGVNTSAMFESLILDRPVISLNLDNFKQGQADTIHYDHILFSNAIFKVYSISELTNLLLNLEIREKDRHRSEFLTQFIRPQGIENPATDLVLEFFNETRIENKRSKAKMDSLVGSFTNIIVFFSGIIFIQPFYAIDLVVTRELRKRRARKHTDMSRFGKLQ